MMEKFITSNDARKLSNNCLMKQDQIRDLWKEIVEPKIELSARNGNRRAYIDCEGKHSLYISKLMMFGERVLGFSIQLEKYTDAFRVYW